MDLGEYEKQRDELQRQFPGWHVWFVPRTNPPGVTWCARPWPLINADTVEELAGDIRAAHAAVPEGSPAVASWRSYRARVRRLRDWEQAAGETWTRMRAEADRWRRFPLRQRGRRSSADSAGTTVPSASATGSGPDVIA